MRSRWDRVGAAAALALVVGGCTSVVMDYPGLPPAEALRSIEPGVTTRAQVLGRLGPPEEMRQPAGFDRSRATLPQARRVLEAGEIFDDRAYTYARARSTLSSFGIFPVGPALFRWTRRRLLEERWRIEFDAQDVVSSVSHVDEIGAPDAAR